MDPAIWIPTGAKQCAVGDVASMAVGKERLVYASDNGVFTVPIPNQQAIASAPPQGVFTLPQQDKLFVNPHAMQVCPLPPTRQPQNLQRLGFNMKMTPRGPLSRGA